MLSPLVVPKIVCSLFTSHNFDHYANSHSLHPPQAAVVFLAPLFRKRDRLSQNFNFYLLSIQYYLLSFYRYFVLSNRRKTERELPTIPIKHKRKDSIFHGICYPITFNLLKNGPHSYAYSIGMIRYRKALSLNNLLHLFCISSFFFVLFAK